MGSVLSAIRSAAKTVGAVAKLLLDLNRQYQALLARVNAAPGIPHERPSSPYWLDDPPFPELVEMQSETLAREADVVVIGSGITGVAVVRGLFAAAAAAAADDVDEAAADGPRVVVLDARALCAGATGRNGGHVKASPHELFRQLARHFGREGAARLTRFALRTAEAVLEVGGAEGREVAECRAVETVDFFLDAKGYEDGVESVEELRRWVPEVEVEALGGEATVERFGAQEGHVFGSLVYKAGALWPYRLVSALWKELLGAQGGRLTLEMKTAVEEVVLDAAGDGERPYVVRTGRGSIRARHVVHATNAHAAHFLTGLRGKMAGLKAHMTAQRPATAAAATTAAVGDDDGDGDRGGSGFRWKDGSGPGSRSWSILYGGGLFDYVTQRPNGDVMLGGGFGRSAGQGVDMVGVWDDSGTEGMTVAHVAGVMKALFGARWSGNVTRAWSGILAMTGDMAPFVGRVPGALSGAGAGGKGVALRGWRGEKKMRVVRAKKLDDGEESGWKGAGAGEWVSAGYCGDGMVWAWLCGTALGVMVAGQENVALEKGVGFPGGKLDEWFPRELLITEARAKKADLSNLVDELL